MIPTKNINDRKVIPYKGQDNRPYKFEDMFSHPYENILVIGPKNTGKSMICGSIVLNTITNKSVFRLYSTTWQADHTAATTVKKLKKRKIDVETYNTIEFGDLEAQLKQIREFIDNDGDNGKLAKMKYRFPLVIYVWDDARQLARTHKEISDLFAQNRHYRILNIFSSQRYKDVEPVARQNTQVLILTAGLSKIVLKSIYEDQPIHLTFDDFYKLYVDATMKKYSFLFCDFDKNLFRRNFNEQYIVKLVEREDVPNKY